jgi:hypothetical protein
MSEPNYPPRMPAGVNGSPAGPTAAPVRPPRGAFRQVLVTVLARLRFVAVLAAIGAVIVQWDTLAAYYEKWTRSTATAAAADPDSEYFCPMHPSVVRDTNKEKCPICFMPLAKRKKGEVSDAPLPPGVVSRVQLSPYRVVLAGVKTAPVDYQPLVKEVITVGNVEFDERGLKHVAARVKGRIDRLLVNQTGQLVHAGDELASLYSPDLVVTVQNLLDARRAGNRDLERIARDRLRLWGLGDDQVDAMLRSGKPVTHVTVRSPADGHVLKRYQTEGRYVDEGTPLYDVADLSTVWVQAQVYEDDLAFLPGDGHARPDANRLPVTATTPAFPGETFAGTLSFVYLREAIEKRGGLENIRSLDELREAVIEGAVHRLRPKLLTEGVAIVAIFPMVFATGVGGEVLAPMALPVLGGLLISDEVIDLFLPVRFYWVRRARWLKLHEQRQAATERDPPSAPSPDRPPAHTPHTTWR